jgi:hypothetical protein
MPEELTCPICNLRFSIASGFNGAYQCATCGAKLCDVCGAIGRRTCRAHVAAPKPTVTSAIHTEAQPTAEPVTTPGFSDTRLKEAFFSGFDAHVRGLNAFCDPTGDVFLVDPRIPSEEFRCPFGEVRQFSFQVGIIEKKHAVLAAVSLERDGLVEGASGPEPAPGLFSHIGGRDGLRFEDQRFYVVGVFSPVGWPEHWKMVGFSRGHVHSYLVSKVAGSSEWRADGPDSELSGLYDAERPEQRAAREQVLFTKVQERLKSCRDLRSTAGSPVPIDSFCRDYNLDLTLVQRAVTASTGYELWVYEGMTYIRTKRR